METIFFNVYKSLAHAEVWLYLRTGAMAPGRPGTRAPSPRGNRGTWAPWATIVMTLQVIFP